MVINTIVREQTNSVAKFIDEKMICDPEEDVSVFTFNDEYEEWCVRMGVSLFFPLCLPSTNLVDAPRVPQVCEDGAEH